MIQLNLTDRVGADHVKRSWSIIESQYKEMMYDWVEKRLTQSINKKNLPGKYLSIVRWSRRNLKKILLASPEELQNFVDEVDHRFGDVLHRDTSKMNKVQKETYTKQKEKLLSVYGYKYARTEKLVRLAGWLNVKTCPYCNMQYTLNVQDCDQNDNKEDVALFQFDHFYDKSDYPMLSVSLYNLIPSCPTCNHGKSKGKLSIEFHPYHRSIADNFVFRIKNPYSMIWGDSKKSIEVELIPSKGLDVKPYDKMFHISKQYAWHKDVVQEIFAKEYAFEYYGNVSNFDFLHDNELKKRLKMGYYTNPQDTMLRPLTKFQQDIQKQAHELLLQGVYHV